MAKILAGLYLLTLLGVFIWQMAEVNGIGPTLAIVGMALAGVGALVAFVVLTDPY